MTVYTQKGCGIMCSINLALCVMTFLIGLAIGSNM